MKTKYYFLAALAAMFASCANDEYIGDTSPTALEQTGGDGSIRFGFDFQNTTRADIAGKAAADLLGGNFYVTGTKGTEPSTSPTTNLVFDNYLVHWTINTAGTTESNTANWEYVGIDQTVPTVADRVKLSSTSGAQTIKYWDYSVDQYDFLAFSTGRKKAVAKTAWTGGSAIGDDEIGVTAMAYGAGLASKAVAYKFYVPTVEALENAFISDITEVTKGTTTYGKDVVLRFKNLGSKVRIALYETVPGYSVKDVVFYTVDGTTNFTDASKNGTARLIGDNVNSFPTKGRIDVYFNHVGASNDGEADYNKASATVVPADVAFDKFKAFGALTDQLVGKERAEMKKTSSDPDVFAAEDGNVFLGRTLPTATFAGSEAAKFYQTVFPVSTPYPLTLRVDYTLVPIDGATETINVKGARAVVPSTYTKWLPNYAYTYIFKISDNTNGWTGTGSDPAGLFPITFDAVVAEATDADAEQTTITTVATPSITTYQQNHNPLAPENEYDNDGADVYVQVMDNSTSPATLKADLNGKTPTDDTDRSLLYSVSVATATEAAVMDALENRTTALNVANVTGRNGITLTANGNIDATVDEIVNGVDDNPIDLETSGGGKAAMIDISELSEGTYAYVYDYSTAAKSTTNIYQPVAASVGDVIASGVKYMKKTTLNNESTYTSGNEDVSSGHLYFSKTTNGTGDTTYSFVNVDGKAKVPDGLLKVAVGQLSTGDGSATVATGDIVFTTYIRNTGKYAVKVIKVVN